MNLEQAIGVNVQIATLIKSKHENDGFPGTAARGNVEAKYYNTLLADINKAKSALGHSGISELLDDYVEPPKVQHVTVGDGGRKKKAGKKTAEPIGPEAETQEPGT